MSEAMIQRWSAPSIEGPIVGRRTDTDGEADKQARAAQEARGYEAGVAAGRVQMQVHITDEARIKRMDSILGLLSRPLAELDVELEKQLTALAVTVGRQLARRELTTDPAQIIAIIRECVARLPVAAREIRVQLHPEDAQVVRERLAAVATERTWSIVEDPTLSRGGCVVRTDTSQIDARMESRLNAIIAATLGEEREQTRTETQN